MRHLAILMAGCLMVGGSLGALGEDALLLSVPLGSAPVLDGTFFDGEWSDGIELPLSDDTFLYAKHAEGFLYVGFWTAPGAQVVGNVYIARDDRVKILHASHALGPAAYRLEGGVWMLDRPFVWSCRMLGFSAAAMAGRDAFLKENRWLATVVNLGEANAMEYKIAIEGESMRMLFRFDVYRTERSVLTWPLDTDVGIAPGPLPPEAAFRPEMWCELRFEPDGTKTPEG